MSERQRIDQLLVSTGRFDSRARARAAIEAGLVQAAGRVVKKPSETFAPDVAIEAQAPYPWVSRAGVKLAAALDVFAIDPSGALCLDVGSSTGGFTQVLLARGALSVYAVDVGRDQLHATLRADPRVISLEGQDARTLDASMLKAPPTIVVCDASFISLKLILPAVLPLAAPGAILVALIKPQFEAGRENIGKGGIVRDEAIHARVCDEIVSLAQQMNWRLQGVQPSPIEGGDGNKEFLMCAHKRGETS